MSESMKKKFPLKGVQDKTAEITYLCAETTFSVKTVVARMKDSAKIMDFANFLRLIAKDGHFLLLILFLNCVQLSVLLHVTTRCIFF